MAEGDLGNMSSKELNEIRKEMSLLSNDLTSIAQQQSQILKEAGEYADGIQKSGNEGAKVLRDIGRLLTDQLGTAKGQKKVEKELTKIRQLSLESEIKIFTIKEKIKHRIKEGIALESMEMQQLQKILFNEEARKNTLGESLGLLNKIKGVQEDIAKQTAIFDTFGDLVKDVPILSKLFSDLSQAAKDARQAAANNQSVLLAAGKSYANLLGKATTILTGAMIVKAAKQLDERVTTMQKGLLMSNQSASNLSDNLIEAARATGLTALNGEEFFKATLEINKALGTTGRTTLDMNTAFVFQTKALGMSTEEAAKFSKVMLGIGKNAKEFNEEIISTTVGQNINTNLAINYQDVISDINTMSSSTLLSLNAQGKSITNAAYQARALGISMSQMEGIADSLLDFESSIEAEMQAELMTGRQLNLEKARSAALNNDMVTLAQELNRQNITAASFAKMNRLAQASIAKSFGMSKDEMGDMLVTQEALKSIGKDSLSQLEDEVRLRAKDVGFAKALDEVGNKELKRQIETRTVSARTLDMQQRMLETFQEGGVMNQGLNGIKLAIDKLTESIDYLVIAMSVISTLQIGGAARNFLSAGGGGAGGIGRSGFGSFGNRIAGSGRFGVGNNIMRGLGSGAARFGGLASAGLAGFDEFTGNQAAGIGMGENITRTGARAGLAGLGAYGGAAAGAAIGTAIFPGVGTAIGGLIGGGLGAFAGDFAGDEAGDLIFGETQESNQTLSGIEQGINQMNSTLNTIANQPSQINIDSNTVETFQNMSRRQLGGYS